MKRLLLFAAALAATAGASTAMAQKVTAPVVKDFVNLEFNDVDTVFFYNVKSGMFLREGNAYGTQSSLGNEGTAFAPLKNKREDGSWDGTFTMWNHTKAGNGAYKYPLWNMMFIDKVDISSGGAAYLDRGSQANWKWVIYDKGGMSYEISGDTIAGSATDPTVLGPTRFGWDGAEGSTVVYPTLNIDGENAPNYGLEWKAVKGDTIWMQKYLLRMELYPLINKGVDENITVSSYADIYNNEASTVEELQGAYDQIVIDIRNAEISKADDENPVDVTPYFIKAADCTTLTGWTAVASANKWATHADPHTNPDTGVTIQDYIERWISSSSSLPDGVIYQKLTGLPSGNYKLSADINATAQADQTLVNTGTWLFARSSETVRDSVSCSTGNGLPVTYSLTLLVVNGELTIGFENISTTCNWVCMDNYKLEYFGNGTGVLRKELQTAAQSAGDYSTSVNANEEVMAALDAAIENANNVANNPGATAENIAAAKSTLDVALKATKDNVAAYVTLNALSAEANDMRNAYSETEYPAVLDLGDFIDNVDGDYTPLSDVIDGYMFGTEEINNIIAKLKDLMKKTIYSGITEGKDVTEILADPAFENGGEGWTNKQAVDKTQKNCEAYEKTFDQYQILTDLPNGKYTVKAQAFQRLGSNDAAFTNWQEGKGEISTFIYANNVEKAVKNIFDDAQAEQCPEFEAGAWQADYETANSTYVPNSMQGARYYMDNGLYDNEISGLVSDGVLRLGIKCTYQTGSYWTIFDNFRLIYNGNSIEALKSLVDEAQVKVNALAEKPMCADSLNAMKAAYETAAAETDGEKLIAELALLNAAISAANNSVATYATLADAMEWSFNKADTTVRSAEAKAAFDVAYAAVESVYKAGGYADADILTAIKTVKSAANQYLIFDDAKVATETNPKDVSYLINNADIAETRDGWTFTKTEGNDAVSYGCFEVWQGNYSFSQELYGLPGGKYKLVVKGFYRDGANADLADSIAQGKLGLNAKLFINEAIGDIRSITDGARDTTGLNSGSNSVYLFDAENMLYTPNNMQNAEAFFKADAAGTYDATVECDVAKNVETMTIGVKKDILVTNDWSIFDKFTLYYLGDNGDGIDNVDSNSDANAVSVKYYDANGIERGRIGKGLNIIKSTLSDGTVKVRKVVLK